MISIRRKIRGLGLNMGNHKGRIKITILVLLAFFSLFTVLSLNTEKSSAADCDCTACHGVYHGPTWQGCATCHGFPPATGSHLTHFSDPGNVTAVPGTGGQYQPYGSTTTAADYYPATPAPSYMMGCGNCHPLDPSMHQNGTVEVELYNAAADPSSLKAKNPIEATYTPGGTVNYDAQGLPYTLGTCENVYCHSYKTWTGTAGLPTGVDPVTGNNTYAPYTVTTTVNYQSVTWGNSLTCSGCHGTPPTTSLAAGNNAGLGDSHQWINGSGNGYLHMKNMLSYFGPISCTSCHNDTVTAFSTYTQNPTTLVVTAMQDIPIANHAMHVNGAADVAFDQVNPFVYNSQIFGTTYSAALNTATYDAATKTCSNVACHYNSTNSEGALLSFPLKQPVVQWGMPYRDGPGTPECNTCHVH